MKKITAEEEIKNIKKSKNKMFDQIERCRIDLQKDPTNAALHLRLGDLYLKWHLDIFNAGQYIDEAITEYQLAMESLIDSCEIYYKLGVAFYHKGDLDKAINYFTMALEKKNNYYDAYYMLAETFVKKAHFTDAIDAAEAAIQCAPLKSSSAHYLLCKLYEASSFKDNRTKTKALLEKCASALLVPFDRNAQMSIAKNISYLRFLPLFLQGFYAIQVKDYAKAIQLYKNAIETAAVLKNGLKKAGYEFYIDSPTNQIFIVIDNGQLKELQKHVTVSFWEKKDDLHTVIRFATSWATRMENVYKVLEVLQGL